MTLDLKALIGGTTFVAGSEKHAGKTTFIKFLQASLHEVNIHPVLMSIGLDGEGNDLMTGIPKPHIHLSRGDFLLTLDSALIASQGYFEILHVFENTTALGRPVLAKSLRQNTVELIRGGDNRQLAHFIELIRQLLPHATILIDGAANRLTQITSDLEGSFFMLVRVKPYSLKRNLDKIRQLILLQELSSGNSITPSSSSSSFFLKGVLSRQKLDSIPEHCREVHVEDFTKIFLNYKELQAFLQKYKLRFSKEIRLQKIVVILEGLTQARFLDQLALDEGLISRWLLFNPYQGGF